MSIDEFIEEVKNVANTYSLKVEILARTKNAIKIRVPITENIITIKRVKREITCL